MEIEYHPLSPFLPSNARLLMLGSFPPQSKRWSMDFYYPNWNNDMWRIMGLLFFDNKKYFEKHLEKAFDRERIISFLSEKGIALFDTALAVKRLQDNASDKYLEIVEKANISEMLLALPLCETLVTTGEKATETLCADFAVSPPQVGSFVEFFLNSRKMRIYRMPSSSRAYPLALNKKAESYRLLFQRLNML